MKAQIVKKGGKGSGFYSHAGRPGKVGGSAPSDESTLDSYNPKLPFLKSQIEEISENPFAPYVDKKMNTFLNEHMPAVERFGRYYTDWHSTSEQSRSVVKREVVADISKRSGVRETVVDDVIKSWASSANDGDRRSLSFQEAVSEEFGVPLSDFQKDCIAKERQLLQSRVEQNMKWLWEIHDSGSVYGSMGMLTDSDIEQREVASHVNEANFEEYVRKYVVKHTPAHRPSTTRENERKIARAIYENTQDALEKAGIHSATVVTLYRGINLNPYHPRVGSRLRYKGNAVESWSVGHNVAVQFPTITLGIRVRAKDIFSTAVTGLGCLPEGEVLIFGSRQKEVTVLSRLDDRLVKK